MDRIVRTCRSFAWSVPLTGGCVKKACFNTLPGPQHAHVVVTADRFKKKAAIIVMLEPPEYTACTLLFYFFFLFIHTASV